MKPPPNAVYRDKRRQEPVRQLNKLRNYNSVKFTRDQCKQVIFLICCLDFGQLINNYSFTSILPIWGDQTRVHGSKDG